jgi:nicotinamide-nucleotide amidase
LGGKIVVVASAGEDAYELAGQILARLEAGGRTVAVAESLTGGLVAAALTDIPGASASFRGGVVTYATELKASLLGVDRGMLARHGAGSRWAQRTSRSAPRTTRWCAPSS